MINISVSNKHYTTWKINALYGISEIAVVVSEISLFRHRNPALSTKYA